MIVITELVGRLAGPLMFALILLAMTFWLETTGAMGFALSIMLNSVVVFILFGISILATGRLRSGPTHAAIALSAAFAAFSGSAAANVVGTGAFTIPLIKSHGFSPHFAAGIEAAAFTWPNRRGCPIRRPPSP